MTEIILSKGQFKSLEICKEIAKGLSIIEQHFGIKTVKITVKDSFICPDIEDVLHSLNDTPMERVLQEVLCQLIQ